MSFERKFIDPILRIIRDNQDYLCQLENLPQLAKLGYIYNTLWYSGRICWGQNGILKKRRGGYVCEENPKYKLEMCEPTSEKHEELIYDAWSLHLDQEIARPSSDEFEKVVFGNTVYSELEIKLRKPNKTFDEWVEALTDKQCKHNSIYSNRKAVANHLLCVIGNGYMLNNGFVVQKAGGADQDRDLYGFWENAVFPPKIQKRLEKLLKQPIVEETLDASRVYIQNEKKKRHANDSDHLEVLRYILIKEGLATEEDMNILTVDELDEMLDALLDNISKEKVKKGMKKAFRYYGISSCSIITQYDKNTHPSYVEAGREICQEILKNRELYLEDRAENIIFAEKYLAQFP
jgi:hypothetical protein